jgi:hypothetical protein
MGSAARLVCIAGLHLRHSACSNQTPSAASEARMYRLFKSPNRDKSNHPTATNRATAGVHPGGQAQEKMDRQFLQMVCATALMAVTVVALLCSLLP